MSDRQTTTAKILALLPVVSLAAACNGLAPTGPSGSVGSHETNASSASGGVAAATTSPSPCQAIIKVDLQAVDSSRTYYWVEAAYQYSRPGVSRCAAPKWVSDRRDLVVDRMDPFRAGFPRSATGQALLTATAPNGVHNSIRLNFDGGSDASSLIRPGDDNCAAIVGVDLRMLPTQDDVTVWIQASYVFPGDTVDNCRAPPTFSASRPGLRIHERDKFRAGIDNPRGDSRIATTVTATAPNGVANKITF